MTLAVLATSYPRAPDDPAGCFVRAEALEAADRGRTVVVIAPGAGPDDAGVTVVSTGGADAFGWPGVWARLRERPTRVWGWAQFVVGARRALGALRPEAVQCHWLVPCLSPIAEGFDGPVEAVAHGADVRLLTRLPPASRRRLVEHWLDRGIGLRFVATALREQLTEGLPPNLAQRLRQRSWVCPAALGDLGPRADRAEVRSRWDLPQDETVMIVVSRLLPSKRVDLALELARARHCVLVVVGDGPAEAALRVRARGAPIRFVGRTSRPDTLDLIAAADVLLHPSDVDAAPTVVREARALGVPVASRGAGDVPRWAADDPDLRVAPSLAEALPPQ